MKHPSKGLLGCAVLAEQVSGGFFGTCRIYLLVKGGEGPTCLEYSAEGSESLHLWRSVYYKYHLVWMLAIKGWHFRRQALPPTFHLSELGEYALFFYHLFMFTATSPSCAKFVWAFKKKNCLESQNQCICVPSRTPRFKSSSALETDTILGVMDPNLAVKNVYAKFVRASLV